MRMVVRKLLVPVSVALIAIIVVVVYSMIKGKNYTPFIEQVSAANSKLIDYNGQTVAIGDYTIKLEKTIYDEKMGKGNLEFSIKKKDGKPEAVIDSNNPSYANSFGPDGRFRIVLMGSVNQGFQYKGETLYDYIDFEVNDPSDLSIYLIDNDTYDRATGDYKKYEFKVKDSVDTVDYKIDSNTTLTLSPLGIAITTTKAKEVSNITLHYKDGKEEIVVDIEKDIGIGGSGAYSCEGVTKYTYVFDKVRDINAVEYIMIDNNKY